MSDIDIRVDIAPDAEPDGDSTEWAWLDVSGYRRQASDIELNAGRDDETSDAEPADSSLVFDLRDGLLSPRNPNSELYGRIGVNTPIRYRLGIVSDSFDRTVASGLGTSTSGHTWSASSTYSVSSGAGHATFPGANFASEAVITDMGALDVDIVHSVSLPVLALGGPWISATVLRRLDASNAYRVHTELKPAGVITMKIVRREDGANTDLLEVTATATYTAGGRVWTRVQAEGGTIRGKCWTGLIGDEPGTWDLSAPASRIMGAGFGLLQWRFASNTNPGSLTIDIDDFAAEALIWQGNVPEWSPVWSKGGEDATVPVAAAGPLRRLAAGKSPIRSPLTRQLLLYNPSGYWPFEDDSTATSAASALPSGPAATVVDVDFSADSEALPGAVSMAKINSTASRASGRVTGTSSVEISGMMFWRLATLPAGDVLLFEWTSQGTIQRWRVYATATAFSLRGYNSRGVQLVDSATLSMISPLQTFSIQLETEQDGANIDWSLIWNAVGDETFWANGGTVAGSCGPLTGFNITGSTGLVDALFGHVWLGDEQLPYVDPTFLKIGDGYAGEPAADRIARLCAEEGVPVTVAAGDSEALGRQRAGKFLDLLREAAAADMGILSERAAGLAYLPRGGRYNPPVSMELDWTGGDLAEAPEPKDDDQRLRNRWIVKRLGGSEATHEDPASIAKRGVIEDSVEINIESDSRLAQQASWRTAVSALDQLRWPTISINLIAHPELIPFFLAIREGSRITVINPKDQIPGVQIDLIVEGIKQNIGRHAWTVDLACSPAQPWTQVGIWDDPESRWDSATTTLGATSDETDVTLTLSVNSPITEVWSTTASGYLLNVAGEFVEVQSIGAPTGTGPYTQIATVLRSQNGVIKGHAIGTRVSLAHPVRWAL